MNKVTVGIIIALLLGLGGLAIWSSANNSKIDYSKYDSTKIIAADENNGNIGDHVRGKEDSPVVVVEYADLQCPGCATMMPKMSEIYEQYGDRVAFVFRSWPLSYHQNARSASAAAEAAGYQGYYWDMLETMYDYRDKWIDITDTVKRTNIYTDIFKEVSNGNGDVEKFKKDLDDANIKKKIDFDYGVGKERSHVTATPSIYVNGKLIDINNSDEETSVLIKRGIDDSLKAAGLATGPAETK